MQCDSPDFEHLDGIRILKDYQIPIEKPAKNDGLIWPAVKVDPAN